MNGSEDHPKSYDYDLIIIGGGSGGLAAAKARVLVCFWLVTVLQVLCGICLSHSCAFLRINLDRRR